MAEAAASSPPATQVTTTTQTVVSSQEPSALLISQAPEGFAPIPGEARTLTAAVIAAAAAQPGPVLERLQLLGFRTGFIRTWFDSATHQYIIAAVGEYRNAGAAAFHKLDVNGGLLKTRETPSTFIAPPIPGAVGVHYFVHAAGKLPQSSYEVIFRVDRWFFEIIGGFNVGAQGSTDPGLQLTTAVANRQYAQLETSLHDVLTPKPRGGSLRVTGRYCTCSLALPATWDSLPYDKRALEKAITPQGTESTPAALIAAFGDPKATVKLISSGYLIGGSGTRTGSNGEIAYLVRFPIRKVRASDPGFDLFGGLGQGPTKVDRLELPVGTARRVRGRVLVIPSGEMVDEAIITFEHHAYTYALFVVEPEALHVDVTKIARSIRFGDS